MFFSPHAGVIAVAAAISAAACYATAAVLQERLVAGVPGRRLATLLTRPAWWVAVGVLVAGAGLHLLALRHGPLSLVQPLGAVTLVLALPLRAAVTGRPVARPHWRGAGMAMAGLAVLLLLTAPVARVGSLGPAQVPLLAGVAAAAVAVLVVCARLVRRGAGSHLLLAAAAGVAFGAGSALTQAVTLRVTADGVAGLLTPATVMVAAFATGGLLLAQASYRGGGLGAPLATLALVNPMTAIMVGHWLLGERYAAGALGVALALAAGAVAAWGVVTLARPAGAPGQRPGGRAGPPAAYTPGRAGADCAR